MCSERQRPDAPIFTRFLTCAAAAFAASSAAVTVQSLRSYGLQPCVVRESESPRHSADRLQTPLLLVGGATCTKLNVFTLLATRISSLLCSQLAKSNHRRPSDGAVSITAQERHPLSRHDIIKNSYVAGTILLEVHFFTRAHQIDENDDHTRLVGYRKRAKGEPRRESILHRGDFPLFAPCFFSSQFFSLRPGTQGCTKYIYFSTPIYPFSLFPTFSTGREGTKRQLLSLTPYKFLNKAPQWAPYVERGI